VVCHRGRNIESSSRCGYPKRSVQLERDV